MMAQKISDMKPKIAAAAAAAAATTPDVKTGDLSQETLTLEDDEKLRRKIDRWLLPVCALTCFFQFMDKAALGSVAIMGFRQDLHLTGQAYSWASGIYYFGYLIASYPMAMIMVRTKVGKTITASIFIWGVILVLTVTCFNSAGLLANRFFLGAAESVVPPGLTVVISMFYRRSEQPLRHGLWFMGNSLAGICGSLLAFAIGHVDTMKPWKAVFVIFGILTVSWSVASYFLLPDSPTEARFLSRQDRQRALVRVNENMTGIKNDKIKWGHVREALLDVKVWFIVVYQIAANIPNGGFLTFQGIIVSSFGFSTFSTLLLCSVPYGLQIVLALVGTACSSYFRNTRTYFMALYATVSIAGTAMVRFLPQEEKWARFAGTVLQVAFSANYPLVMSLMSGNFGGFTKKTTVNAMSFMAYCVGNIIGPQLFFDDEAPTYPSGFLGLLVCQAVMWSMCWVIRFYMMWENRRRDRTVTAEELAAFEAARDGVMVNMTDLTDKEIPAFRYVY